MRRILVFDKHGKYIEDNIVNDTYLLAEYEIEVGLLEEIVFRKPILVNGVIVEGITSEELEEESNLEKPSTHEDYLIDLDYRLSLIELRLI